MRLKTCFVTCCHVRQRPLHFGCAEGAHIYRGWGLPKGGVNPCVGYVNLAPIATRLLAAPVSSRLVAGPLRCSDSR